MAAIAAVAMLMGCGAGDDVPPTPSPHVSDLSPRPGDERLKRGPVFLDASEPLVLESYPPRYMLRLRGSLPTPCHQPRAVIDRDEARAEIRVEVYSLSEPGAVCAQVLTPFEGYVSLGSASRRYQVLVNGQPVGPIGP